MSGKPKYETAEELQEAIDGYFILETKYCISGLCYYLGFESRQSFYDYEERELFSYTIKRARLRIEMAYEKQLHDSSCTGSIFALKNFGWKDKVETEHSGTLNVNPKQWVK
jgi:hypothetical protein